MAPARALAAFAVLRAASAACTLEAPGVDDAPGAPSWVQVGPVLRLYTTKTYPRQIIASNASDAVDVGTFFTPLCTTPGYMIDKGCVVQCTSAGLDYETYCAGLDVNTICKPRNETRMNVECALDFDTDEDVYNIGASLKDIWAQATGMWNTGAALEDMFSPRPPNVIAGDNPVDPKHRLPFYTHNFANVLNMGLAVNVAVSADQLGVGGNFSAASINLAVYAPDEDYAFVEDPLGSTTDGPVFFRDHFDSSLTAYPQFAAAFGGQAPSLWGPTSYNASELGLSARYVASVGMPYDPCDEDGDAKFMGLPKACFHLHQATPHTTNGQIFPFYKPLKDGTLDFFGVCDTTEVSANEYLSSSVFAQQASPDNWNAFNEATIAAGGFYIPTTRTWGLHLCIAPVDPLHPYPCIGSNTRSGAPNSDLSDYMMFDPLWFVHNPVQDAAALCEAHRAGLCNATNAHPSVTGSNETRYEYPVDVPMRWSPYPAVPIPVPTDQPTPAPTNSTPAPVNASRPVPKVRGCGRAALASEKKCNQNRRCKWVFGSHKCKMDCALANEKKCNKKNHCKYKKRTKKCKNKKHVCKYKAKKFHCRDDESCRVKKGKEPKYDAKGNRVFKCVDRKD